MFGYRAVEDVAPQRTRMEKMQIRLLIAAAVWGIVAQPQAAGRPLRFAVLSIRRQPPNFRRALKPEGPVHPGGKYIDHQANLWSLVTFAHPQYDYPNKTIVGLPDWAYGIDELMDIEAEPEPGTSVDLTQMQQMMDAALADRFHLKYHIETREMPVYFLEVADGGPHYIRPSAAGEQSLLLRFAGGAVFGRGASMDLLAGKIGSYYEDRPVLNRTGLNGFFDIASPAPAGTYSNRAGDQEMVRLELQILGLKLVPGKAAVPVMVVDHVTLPTPNP